MDVMDRKYRGLEIWDVDDVAPAIRDEATAAALAVLDLEGVSPLEARVAQFTLEAMDDKGVLDSADPSDFGLDMTHLNACREAEAAGHQERRHVAVEVGAAPAGAVGGGGGADQGRTQPDGRRARERVKSEPAADILGRAETREHRAA